MPFAGERVDRVAILDLHVHEAALETGGHRLRVTDGAPAVLGAIAADQDGPWLAQRHSAGERVEGRGRHGLDAGLERRVDDGGELRVVVGRDVLGDAARLLGPAVGVSVGAADVPEHRRDAPPGPEGPEVLARRIWRGQLAYAPVAELAA